jgi:hypothetical protein
MGRCPNCGEYKDASRAPAMAPGPTGSFWDDLDDAAQIALMLVPGLALVALVVFLFMFDAVAGGAVLVAILLVVGYLLQL